MGEKGGTPFRIISGLIRISHRRTSGRAGVVDEGAACEVGLTQLRSPEDRSPRSPVLREKIRIYSSEVPSKHIEINRAPYAFPQTFHDASLEHHGSQVNL